MKPPHQRELPPVDARVFKERVYATFTGLAVVLVAASAEHVPASTVLVALIVSISGISVAGFAADFIATVASTGSAPDGSEMRNLLRLVGNALGTAVPPVLVLLAAVADWITTPTALLVAQVLYISTLALIGWVVVGRSNLQAGRSLQPSCLLGSWG